MRESERSPKTSNDVHLYRPFIEIGGLERVLLRAVWTELDVNTPGMVSFVDPLSANFHELISYKIIISWSSSIHL